MIPGCALLLTGAPPKPAPRFWRGNFCGIRVPGLPPIQNGPPDPTLVWMPLYPFYSDHDRAAIRAQYIKQHLTHVVLGAADTALFGGTPALLVQALREWRSVGCYPGVMLRSKDYGPQTPADQFALIDPYIDAILAARGACAWACAGWEMDLDWPPATSGADVQALIDRWSPRFIKLHLPFYIHFSEGIFAWEQSGTTATFWNLNVGKLTGLLYQRILSESVPAFYERVRDDCLPRFAGTDGFVTDSGFGHPFDFVAFELSAELQFFDDMTEAEGDAIGAGAVAIGPVTGPTGAVVRVMGSGNGL